MLRLLGRRRRRDELTPLEAQIARDHLPIPGEPVPVRQRLSVVLRHKAIIATAAIVTASALAGGGVYAGATWEDHRDDAQLEKRINAAYEQHDNRLAALGALHSAELEERGILSPEKQGTIETLDLMAKNPPREEATLRAQDELEDATAKLFALQAQRD